MFIINNTSSSLSRPCCLERGGTLGWCRLRTAVAIACLFAAQGFQPLSPPRSPRKPGCWGQQQHLGSSLSSSTTNAATTTTWTTNNNNNAATSAASSSSSSSFPFADEVAALKESIDLVSVVEAYGLDQFQRKSRTSATAVCPFHDDHHPSLSIDANRGLYKCFACGAGGDVFHFVRQMHDLPSPAMTRHHLPASNHSSLPQRPREPLSFWDAVKFVQTEFANGTTTTTFGNRTRETTTTATTTTTPPHRLHAANAAARDFFAHRLIRHPSGGGARRYLTVTRQFDARSVCRYRLGYAPNAYFGSSGSAQWGRGSLVEHLLLQHHHNFTAQEVVDAGLAVIKQQRPQQQASPLKNATSSSNNARELTVNDLMDRFRGRVMVPIYDRTGLHVVGFGGRRLPPPDDDEDTDDKKWQGPKYLNTPETAVFGKHQLLFGQHLAAAAAATATDGVIVVEGYLDAIAVAAVLPSHGVVATMGTALSMQQLKQAASLGSNTKTVYLWLDHDAAGQAAVARIVEQGLLPTVAAQHPAVHFRIVSVKKDDLVLADCKDPADIVQQCRAASSSNGSDKKVAARLGELLNAAVPWSEWYVQRLLQALDDSTSTTTTPETPDKAPDDEGQQQQQQQARDVFHKVASFLSSASSAFTPQQQSHLAQRAAEGLVAGLMGASRKKPTSDSASTATGTVLRDELQSELLDLASRLQATRNMTEDVSFLNSLVVTSNPKKRPQAVRVQGLSRSEKLSQRPHPNRTTAGGMEDWDVQDKLSVEALREQEEQEGTHSASGRLARRRPRAKLSRSPKPAPPLTPHHAGFQFAHDEDKAWLEQSNNNNGQRGGDSLMLPGFREHNQRQQAILDQHSSDTRKPGAAKTSGRRQPPPKPVRHNSNEYHGQWRTPEAKEAGQYGQGAMALVVPPPHNKKNWARELQQKGVADLVRPHLAARTLEAETSLLRQLVWHPAARRFCQNWLCTQAWCAQGGGGANVEFGSPEKQWLWNVLVLNDDESISEDVDEKETPSSLRSYLMGRSDAPPNAFFSDSDGDDETGQGGGEPQAAGTLEDLFLEAGHEEREVLAKSTTTQTLEAAEQQIQYCVQDLLLVLALAATQREMEQVSSELVRQEKMSQLATAESNTNDDPSTDAAESPTTMDHEGAATPVIDMELLQRLADLSTRLKEIETARKRTSERALDANNAFKVEGRISSSVQAQLRDAGDKWVREVGEQHPAKAYSPDGELRPGEEPVEVFYERAEAEWGKFAQNEYNWSPYQDQDAPQSQEQLISQNVEETVGLDEDEESIEDFENRMEKDWAFWK